MDLLGAGWCCKSLEAFVDLGDGNAEEFGALEFEVLADGGLGECVGLVLRGWDGS